MVTIMEPKPVWIEEIRVKTYETDFQGRWKPSCLVQNLIQAASAHASNLGFDYPGMMERDRVWVLSRLKIRFFERPETDQKVVIKTWPKGIQQRLFFMRDFDLRGEDGRPLAAASFAWLLINPKIRRILAPAALGGSIPDNGGMAALDEPLEKIAMPEDLVEQISVEARYSALDLLGHVTSARYVDWICDCFPSEAYLDRQLDWLRINFVNETRPGERLSIATAAEAGDRLHWYIQGSNLGTGLKSFDAELGWKNGHHPDS
jgi:medium-chain acyl-[acyl-carrier-protein] hydrolase